MGFRSLSLRHLSFLMHEVIRGSEEVLKWAFFCWFFALPFKMILELYFLSNFKLGLLSALFVLHISLSDLPSSIPMEQSSSQLNGDAEDCSSSESGWTMYLASPMHDDGSNGDDGEVDGTSGTIVGQGSGHNDQGKEDDDSSMASDASSGTPCKLWNDDDGMCYVKNGTECREDGTCDVVKEKNSQCSSRYSRKNHNEERGKEKGTLSNPSDHKEENGDSISIRSSSKMRRIKSSEK